MTIRAVASAVMLLLAVALQTVLLQMDFYYELNGAYSVYSHPSDPSCAVLGYVRQGIVVDSLSGYALKDSIVYGKMKSGMYFKAYSDGRVEVADDAAGFPGLLAANRARYVPFWVGESIVFVLVALSVALFLTRPRSV